jgi:TolB protein
MASSEPRPAGKRLTADGALKMDPVFVKGGEEIVYTVQETPALMSLMRLRLADGTTERLRPDAITAEFEATFTPDGRYQAFVQSRGNLSLRLVIRDTRENKDAEFNPGGGFKGMHRPSLAPDANCVIFSMAANSGIQIHSVNTVGAEKKLLTSSGFNQWPTFSPDGKRIAFGSDRDGNYEIYVMDADGGHPTRLTENESMDLRPAWSPDGRQIAFTSNRDGNYEIYVMKADGSALRRVTDNPERDDYACWHPNGKQLAIVSERAGRFDLHLVDVP